MKRPQGFDSAGTRLSSRASARPAPGESRSPEIESLRHAATGDEKRTPPSAERATGSRARVERRAAVLEDPRASKPDADTQPIPVLSSAERTEKPHRGQPHSRAPRGADPHARDAGAEARPSRRRREKSVTDDTPASPSVRAAARRRRRYERAEVRRFTRATRRRRLAWLIGAGSVAVVLLAAVLVSFSPAMALRTVRIEGAQRVDAKAVRQAIDPQLGTPLPFVDYHAVRHELSQFPLIRSYSTEAVPPGTLVVRIVERTPLAVLQTKKGYELVDQAHVVMQTTAGRPGGYPLITFSAGASSKDRAKEFSSTAAVLAVLPAATLSQVDSATATGAQDVTLRLSSGATVVWGGPSDADLKSSVLTVLMRAAPGASVYDVSSPKSPVTR